jgi:hypothetical protein
MHVASYSGLLVRSVPDMAVRFIYKVGSRCVEECKGTRDSVFKVAVNERWKERQRQRCERFELLVVDKAKSEGDLDIATV